MNRTMAKTKKDEDGLQLDQLNDKERGVLIAMLTSETTKEAIKKSPVKRSQFFKYKKRLLPLKEELSRQITAKAVEILKGNASKAAGALVELLDSHNQNVKHRAATEVLDRSVGQPKKNIENQNITVIGIQGIEKKDLLPLIEPQS